MAHQVIDNPEVLESQPKKVIRIVERVVEKTKEVLPKIVDSLVLVSISSSYFFFTGLAILFRSPIPKEWMRIGNNLSRGKIAKKIKDMNNSVDNPKKLASHRVVDIESKRTIPISV